MKCTYKEALYDITEDKVVGMIEVTTRKSWCSFVNAYDKARKDWYEEENPPSLTEYLEDVLNEQGFDVCISAFDIRNALIY